VTATLTLTEQELGALDALAGYGVEGFLTAFYTTMGRSYLQPYEKGLRSLFETITATCPVALSDVRKARQALYEQEEARRRKLLPQPKDPNHG
jgi:hypothetical protein